MTKPDKDVIKLLLAAGADVNAKGEAIATPLQTAAARGHKDMVARLLTAGADVNAKGEDGKTAIDLAAEFNRAEVVDFLKG